VIVSYKKVYIPSYNLSVLRPIVRVAIAGPKQQWIGEALLDTGADRSLFDIEVARDVGLDLSNASRQRFGGIGKDQVQVYTIDVGLGIIGMKEKVKIPIGFMENANIRALLGQEGFFDAFKITFDRRRDSIEIK